ncbi:MAG: hypothetical protein Q8Q48_00900 [Candidatus Staskawiczbacteria bacterium]|nr:hypothetical protein [Candidatus Staskawiczbacteria bacterium]
MSEKIEFIISATVILLVITAGLLWAYFDKPNNFRIQNEYYGFEIETPKNWFGEENTYYSMENIAKILSECKKAKPSSSSYEIGAFRFKDQKYSLEDVSTLDISPEAKSGAILEVAISCVPGYTADNTSNFALGNLTIAGENAIKSLMNSSQFGDVEYISLFHNGFKYDIREYVYVSSADRLVNEDKIRSKYEKTFDKIISSLNFLND